VGRRHRFEGGSPKKVTLKKAHADAFEPSVFPLCLDPLCDDLDAEVIAGLDHGAGYRLTQQAAATSV
jgi:hypothetical protein